ncbi:heparan-alpha-glucosaminide N-acetyltransferase [Neorhizobium sp. NCHU2750]|uniref:heparan-alpha-glucosaminide N-acetyltransferase n=1 Tax=Neorhizobium sp. NCHU2750 TaxID=1825976 RepID=UPI000E76898A|nr:membrane protein [Neorhizobium sp. NCHU2750]
MTLADTKPQPQAGGRSPRILLIDTLRGVALIAMASYHFTWDLEYFGYVDPGTATQGFFRIYARCIASTFLFLVGISLVLAHGREIRWQAFGKRLAMVAGAAILVSIATFYIFADEWIYFGILHNIAVTSLIGVLFTRLPWFVPGIVAAVIVALMVTDYSLVPGLMDSPIFDTRWLSWIGFAEMPPRSNDYVPIFPWIAAVLFGIAVAGCVVARGWHLKLANVQARKNILTMAGQHSLAFYLLHQPALLALLYLFSLVHPAPPPDLRLSYINSCQPSCMRDTHNAELCRNFCNCTADRLASENLMTSLQNGTITPQDNRIQILAQECSIQAEQPQQ